MKYNKYLSSCLSALLATALTLAMCSCGDNPSAGDNPPEQPGTPPPSNPPTPEKDVHGVIDEIKKALGDQCPDQLVTALKKAFSGKDINAPASDLAALGIAAANEPKDLTLLHILIGVPEAVKILLANGADLSKPDEKGDTPLHRAVLQDEYKQEANVKKLLASIEDKAKLKGLIKLTNKEGDTPLHCAVKKTRSAFIQALDKEVVKEAINLEDKNKKTPLHLSFDSNLASMRLGKVLLSKVEKSDITQQVDALFNAFKDTCKNMLYDFYAMQCLFGGEVQPAIDITLKFKSWGKNIDTIKTAVEEGLKQVSQGSDYEAKLTSWKQAIDNA